MTTPVWISLGSNLGDRRAILTEALRALGRVSGIVVARVSNFHETTPVGGPSGQGPYLNAAARLETKLTPHALLAAAQQVEHDLGRVRGLRWGERTCDIDLLIYGSKFVDESDLKLPHPRLAVRRFVLEPLTEIAPEAVDTITRRRVADLLANLRHQPRCLMLDASMVCLDQRLHERLATALGGWALALAPPDPNQFPPHLSARRWPHQHADLARVRTLRAGHQDRPAGCVSWVVCNFALDLIRCRELYSGPAILGLDEPTIARARVEAPKLWLARQINEGLVDLIEPTLIVAATNSHRPRRAGISRVPIYWPEATDLESILAEVIAVCRGIDEC